MDLKNRNRAGTGRRRIQHEQALALEFEWTRTLDLPQVKIELDSLMYDRTDRGPVEDRRCYLLALRELELLRAPISAP
jgi:hypothetical protein